MPLTLDIVFDDQGRPVPRRTAQPVGKDIPAGSSALSPAEAVPLQKIGQQATQACHTLQSLKAMVAQVSANLQRLMEPVASRIQQTTAAQAQTVFLTECTRVQALLASQAKETARFQKMLSSIAEENARFPPLQKALSMPSLWKEENKRLQQMAASFRTMEREAQTLINPAPPAWLVARQTVAAHAREKQEHLRRAFSSFQLLIESQWKEGQEGLHRLGAPFQKMAASSRQDIQAHGAQTAMDFQRFRDTAVDSQRLRDAVTGFQRFRDSAHFINKEYKQLQRLVASCQPLIDSRWRAEQERWQRALTFRPFYDPELLQKESDINVLLRAYCPRYRDSHPESEGDIRLNGAIGRLTGHMTLGLRNPPARRELRRRAAQQRISPKDLLRTEIFPLAMTLVSYEADTPQRIRVGRDWATNSQGKVEIVSPQAGLPSRAFVQWWFSQVYAAATAMLLDEPYPRPTTQPVPLLLREEDALERLAAPESPGARDSAMLTALLQPEEMDSADQLHHLRTVASPREKELLLLLCQGLSRNEAAQAMGIKRATADVLIHRTRQKARRR
jgi:DNA-binding CsgD family transcriptional regulator